MAVLQDHVAATFGCGVGTACVVDCGHSKTSVSCVEDGISHAATRVRLPYGGMYFFFSYRFNNTLF